MKYSQNLEEDCILNYFKNKTDGYFIEIGGYDPFTFSNTRKLVELGWSGVYVEPSPICMKNFRTQYDANSKIELFELAITADTKGKMKFYDSGGDAISSLDKEHVDKWTKGYSVQYTEIEVETMQIEAFLKQLKPKCNFFNLDVEGININLFRAVPDWFLNQIDCICIEHDTNIDEISNKLSTHGFSRLQLNGENLIMAKL